MPPKNIVEMQEAIKLYDHLITDAPAKESTFPMLKNHFTILGMTDFVHICAFSRFT